MKHTILQQKFKKSNIKHIFVIFKQNSNFKNHILKSFQLKYKFIIDFQLFKYC